MARTRLGHKKKRREPRVIMARLEPDLRQMVIDTIYYMAEYGFFAKTIAKVAGVSPGQVYFYCRKLGIRLTSYRRGDGKVAKALISRAPMNHSRKFKRSGRKAV